MPNWCDNNLTITHDDPKMIKKLVKAWEADKFFGTIYPEPDYNKVKVKHTFPINASTGEPKPEYVDPSVAWWDWRVQNWGTKWDIATKDFQSPQLDDDGTCFFAYFDTAWSPATGIYEKLVEQGYRVEAYYFESGCAFCGSFTNDGGDQCFSIDPPEGLSRKELADWFHENIPPEILENMDILSCYDCADYQLEEEEEA